MVGETVKGGEVQQQESLNDRCARLIPGYHGYETSLIISEGRATGVTPDEASYFARNLARSVLEGTAPFGTVDPESEHGKELAAFVAELDPAADAIAARWTEQSNA